MKVLKKELDQHRGAQFGLSRSNTCTPITTKAKSPVLPSIPLNTNQADQKFEKPACFMFTKLDADRNKRRLKRAQNRGVLSDKAFEVNEFKSLKKM